MALRRSSRLGTAIQAKQLQFDARRKTHAATQRANSRVAEVNNKLARVRNSSKEALGAMIQVTAEQPIFSALAEFGGTLTESALHYKFGDNADYAALGGFLIEAIATYEAITGEHTPTMMALANGAASVGRGLRARQTLKASDQIIKAIFG